MAMQNLRSCRAVFKDRAGVLYVRVAPNPIERRGTANRTPSSRAVGETITLRWTNGLFLPVSGVSNLEKLAAERRREELFLKLLEQFTRQGRNTCEKAFASTYAPCTDTVRQRRRSEAGRH
jgi:hypothetical protein